MVHDLYILMITAGVVSLIFKLLKQPVVLGYIVAGVLVGPYLFGETLVSADNVKAKAKANAKPSPLKKAISHTIVTKRLVNLFIENMSAHDQENDSIN